MNWNRFAADAKVEVDAKAEAQAIPEAETKAEAEAYIKTFGFMESVLLCWVMFVKMSHQARTTKTSFHCLIYAFKASPTHG